MTAKEKLALELFESGAIQFGAFKLKLHETDPNAPLSPIYFNLRTADNPKPGPLTPEIMMRIGQELFQLADTSGINYDHIIGIPNAGNPFAEALAIQPSAKAPNLLRMSKEEVDGGRRIGPVVTSSDLSGNMALLVDDLITKADSKLEAIAMAKKAGLKVEDIIVLVDRQQGGAKQLAAAGYNLHAVFRLSDLLDLYVLHNKIDQEKVNEVREYIRQS